MCTCTRTVVTNVVLVVCAGTVKDVHTLVGKRIATSFPQLTKKHFASLKGELGDAAPESATSIRSAPPPPLISNKTKKHGGNARTS